MPRKKEEPKRKLVLQVAGVVVDELDAYAKSILSSRNKAATLLLIFGLGINRRTTARSLATQLTAKKELWEVWCRLRRWYWAFSHLHREVGEPLGDAIKTLPRSAENDHIKQLWEKYDSASQSLLGNLSVRVRFLLGILGRWAGLQTAPETISNKGGKSYPCRAVAEKEYAKLGERRELPSEDADLD